MAIHPYAQIAINHVRRAQDALQAAQQYGTPWLTSGQAHGLTALCGAEGVLAHIIAQLATAGRKPPEEVYER